VGSDVNSQVAGVFEGVPADRTAASVVLRDVLRRSLGFSDDLRNVASNWGLCLRVHKNRSGGLDCKLTAREQRVLEGREVEEVVELLFT
jgi:hypothetical protein